MPFEASRLFGASVVIDPGAIGKITERMLMELEQEEAKLAQEAGIPLSLIEENCPAVCQGCLQRCKQTLQAAETTINICSLFDGFKKLKEESLNCSHALIVGCVIREFEPILRPVFSKIISAWFTTKLEKLKTQFESLKEEIREQHPNFSEQRIERKTAEKVLSKLQQLIEKTKKFLQPQETRTLALAIYHSIPHAELVKFMNKLMKVAK